MKVSQDKAVIVGGSNGIGLAIVNEMLDRNYYVYILDICEPDSKLLSVSENYKYIKCNLLDLDEELFVELSRDSSVKALMITAGIGRVAEFEYLHIAEIENVFKINAVSTIKILSIFYDRIKNTELFYCGVMGSIAGMISSPVFSVYAASKAGICRFVESVNVELEMSGVKNRILNVVPGSIKGTRFNGGKNDLSMIKKLAEKITDYLLNSNMLYIPEYEEIYKDIIQWYKRDSHEYGIHSYQYKKNSGRIKNCENVKIGYLSGTFDLFHIGHLNLLQRAKEQCDYLIVGVHESGAWKGKETFIPFEERKAIVEACRYVDKVVMSCREDSEAWDLWHYNRLFVGSDYKGTERFKRYEKYFKDKGVEIIYFPYTQGISSTKLREKLSKDKA